MDLVERDLNTIWHPYTQMKTAAKPIPIIKGEGVYLYTEDARKLIDAVSSWWVNIHGHSHPYIAQKAYEQLQTLEHVIFAGFTHPQAVQLAENLLSILPTTQQKIFYSDNGSTAVEVALKMCLQYWFNKGEKRQKILAFKNAYHGDTFGAMAVSGRSAWTAPFDKLLFDVEFIDLPNKENIPLLKSQITNLKSELACFIYEPLIQGSGGMLMYNAEDLDEILQHCADENILTIADEVMTGFGRTGKLFATDYTHVKPDIMCFSKGLTGGTMALGITSCTQEIYNQFLSDDKLKTLFHGHSFTANPLACAVANASFDLLMRSETINNIERIKAKHQVFKKEVENHHKLKDVRQIGTIIALEWNMDDTSYFHSIRDILYHFFLDRDLLLRPLGNIIYIMPPYCISDEDLDYIYTQIKEAVDTF